MRNNEAVAAAIRTALGQVSPRTHAVTVVIPDTVVRVFVLDFDSLPAKAAEIYPVLRFRLRKMVPFEVEHAGLSYQVLSQKKDECRVLAAVMPGPILAEYEAAVRSAGYEPGAVLPSSLAAVEAIDSMEAVLLANLSSVSLTTAVINGQDLLLYRTLDLPNEPEQRVAELQRGIAVAAAYFEDRLGAPPSRLYYSGCERIDEFSEWIGENGLSTMDLVERPAIGATTALGNTNIAAVSGALVGAR